VSRHYFANGSLIYSDKIAKFACACDAASDGAVIQRLAQRFDHIYVDEIQDMAGYDLDLLERMLRAGIQLSMIGDHRQATYSTNNAQRNSAFARSDIAKKFSQWEQEGLVDVSYERHTFRCNQLIADLADSLYPGDPSTQSLNSASTEHDGVFLIASGAVADYVKTYRPQVLRLDRRTKCAELPAMNFGESKGLTFERTLIFPHGLAKTWLSTGITSHIKGSLAKLYVGITRASQSVAFVHDGTCPIANVRRWERTHDEPS
jgi:DNA helicase-2/ATP-dependent DNA helicase PcrA